MGRDTYVWFEHKLTSSPTLFAIYDARVLSCTTVAEELLHLIVSFPDPALF